MILFICFSFPLQNLTHYCLQDLSSEACKLGKRIIANCAKRLKPHLVQKAQSMGSPLSDYCKMLADICQDKSVNLKQSQLTDSNESLVCMTKGLHMIYFPHAHIFVLCSLFIVLLYNLIV